MKIDTGHWTAGCIDTVITDVITRFDTNADKQWMIYVLHQAIGLHGEDVLAKWRRQAETYPPELAATVIAEHLRSITSFGIVEMLAVRNEIPLLYLNFYYRVRRVLDMLTALNCTWYNGFKWTRQQCEEYRLAPSDLFARLQRVFHADPQIGVAELKRLNHEVFDLIETHCASEENRSARERFGRSYHEF